MLVKHFNWNGGLLTVEFGLLLLPLLKVLIRLHIALDAYNNLSTASEFTWLELDASKATHALLLGTSMNGVLADANVQGISRIPAVTTFV